MFPLLTKRLMRSYACKFMLETIDTTKDSFINRMMARNILQFRPYSSWNRKNRLSTVKELECDLHFRSSIFPLSNEKDYYNIERVLALYKSYWVARNKFLIYARPCVNKMTWAFCLLGFRVFVLLRCSAVSLLFEIWKKPVKNCSIFLSALTF